MIILSTKSPPLTFLSAAGAFPALPSAALMFSATDSFSVSYTCLALPSRVLLKKYSPPVCGFFVTAFFSARVETAEAGTAAAAAATLSGRFFASAIEGRRGGDDDEEEARQRVKYEEKKKVYAVLQAEKQPSPSPPSHPCSAVL
jgi:hypothetical protein